jgi:hypothetical protein
VQNTLYLFAMTPSDLLRLVAVIVGAKLIGLFIFWLFYGVCNLGAGLSMRLAHLWATLLFLIAIFCVFRDLMKYFVFWHYTPGPYSGVLGDAILVLALSLLWMILVWTIWPKPRRVALAV